MCGVCVRCVINVFGGAPARSAPPSFPQNNKNALLALAADVPLQVAVAVQEDMEGGVEDGADLVGVWCGYKTRRHARDDRRDGEQVL